jgi:hypothetical protein
METVTKAHEDAFLISSRIVKCASESQCKGVTARTVHGRSFGKPLDAFVTPAGIQMRECVLCIRARVSKTYYEVLHSALFPSEPIHPYVVAVDAENEYDAALCIGPLDVTAVCAQSAFVGVVGPF